MYKVRIINTKNGKGLTESFLKASIAKRFVDQANAIDGTEATYLGKEK